MAKDIYLGIRLPASEPGYQALELSITGLDPIGSADRLVLLVAQWSVSPEQLIGYMPAPADTTMPGPGTGGVGVAWGECQSAGIVARLGLFPLEPLVDHVLEVRQAYPPRLSLWSAPAFGRCDGVFTAARLTGGSYVLNPGLVSSEPRSWSGVKGLFR